MGVRIESAEEFVEEFIWFRMLHPTGRKANRKKSEIYCRNKRGPEVDELNRMYNGLRMSAAQIAKECDISQSYTRALLKKYGIRKIGYNGQ